MKMKWNKEIPSYNMIGVGTTITGNVQVKGDFRIDGSLIGNIECSGKLTIGASGFIEGQIVCQNAENSGIIKGNIEVSELLFLKDNSNFHGDILTVKIAV